MSVFWGAAIVIVGLCLLICGLVESDFILYRLLVARSKILWDKNVHRFYQISGLLVVIVGLLVIFGII
jgi:predicted DNA-binding transcriptional regulator